jgi:hypothetical protein
VPANDSERLGRDGRLHAFLLGQFAFLVSVVGGGLKLLCLDRALFGGCIACLCARLAPAWTACTVDLVSRLGEPVSLASQDLGRSTGDLRRG